MEKKSCSGKGQVSGNGTPGKCLHAQSQLLTDPTNPVCVGEQLFLMTKGREGPERRRIPMSPALTNDRHQREVAPRGSE